MEKFEIRICLEFRYSNFECMQLINGVRFSNHVMSFLTHHQGEREGPRAAIPQLLAFSLGFWGLRKNGLVNDLEISLA